jgi:hypothetical protein
MRNVGGWKGRIDVMIIPATKYLGLRINKLALITLKMVDK